MDYNIIIIGGGPAGYTAAIRAAQEGLKVALIERSSLGGTCLNRGCIPTKALLHSTGKFAELKASEAYGITALNITIDMNKAYAHKDEIISKLVNGVKSLVKANKIDYYEGNGSFVSEKVIAAGTANISGDNIIIATGSIPSSIPVPGIEYTINSDEVLSKPIDGDRIAIIGGGVIGVEFATMLVDSGKTVYVIEALDRLVPMMDADLSNGLTMALKKKKVKIMTSSRLSSITYDTVYKIFYQDKTGDKELEVDKVILCTGRRANTEGLGLNNIGITTVKGTIKVDSNYHTGIGNIYAVGDVIGGIQLAHFAAAQGITAVESILKKPHSINLSFVPQCVYTNPEIASIGLTEIECEGRNIEIGKFLMGANGKALINGQSSGFVKTIIDKDTDKIIGAQLLMANATDIIGELALAVSAGITRAEFLKVIHAHPTISEAVYESIEDSEKRSIHMLPR